MNLGKKLILVGFGFGTAGLYILAALSMALPTLEGISLFLMFPARAFAGLFVGSETNLGESMVLWFFSGTLYSLIFYSVGTLIFLYAKNNKGRR